MSNYVDELIQRYPVLSSCEQSITDSIEAIAESISNGGTIFVAGNGGSAADAEHICGEFLKGFLLKRSIDIGKKSAFHAYGEIGDDLAHKLQQGIRAISLLSHPGFASAFSNDVDASMVFAQQLYALGRVNDIFIAISTGGNAENIKKALVTAKVLGIKTILLTGSKHGSCEAFSDVIIAAPESETYKIQELHLPIYHTICMSVEYFFFN